MSKAESNKKTGSDEIPDSSSKIARGSTSVHSEKDQSKEDGFKPNYPSSEEK